MTTDDKLEVLLKGQLMLWKVMTLYGVSLLCALGLAISLCWVRR